MSLFARSAPTGPQEGQAADAREEGAPEQAAADEHHNEQPSEQQEGEQQGAEEGVRPERAIEGEPNGAGSPGSPGDQPHGDAGAPGDQAQEDTGEQVDQEQGQQQQGQAGDGGQVDQEQACVMDEEHDGFQREQGMMQAEAVTREGSVPEQQDQECEPAAKRQNIERSEGDVEEI